MAGLYKDIWTGETIKAFREQPENVGWLNKIKSYNEAVAENNTINFVDLGGDPDVLVNNTSYPLQVQQLSDTNVAVTLNKFQTKPTAVSDDVALGLSYDKIGSVIERHREAVNAEKWTRAIHAIAPATNTDATPVIKSGTAGKIKATDIIALKAKFDANHIPVQGRILVLCPSHVADLLAEDTTFATRYNANTETGKIGTLYGFEIYEFTSGCPYFDKTTLAKAAYGSVIDASTQNEASVAFYAPRIMQAQGVVKAYIDEPTTTNQQWQYNVREYYICQPLKAEGIAALIYS